MTSDYEKMREGNIREFRELFKKQFGEYPGETSASSIAQELSTSLPGPTSCKRKRSYSRKTLSLTPTRRSARLQGVKPSTACIESDEDDYDYEAKTLKSKLKKIRNVTPRVTLRREIIPPEDVEEKDLEKICYKSAGKVYDSANGSTCHQCRQKTADMKSICRNKECVGIRGQFCGFCLHNRYGENVAVILKDPNWSCPPCRNICNCSICRRREGKLPTGILVPEAQSRGFSNVKDFLETVDEDQLIEDHDKSDEDEDKLNDDENESDVDEDKLNNDENESDGDKDKLNDDENKLDEDEDNKLVEDEDKLVEDKDKLDEDEDKLVEDGDKLDEDEDEDKLLDVGDDFESWKKVIF